MEYIKLTDLTKNKLIEANQLHFCLFQNVLHVTGWSWKFKGVEFENWTVMLPVTSHVYLQLKFLRSPYRWCKLEKRLNTCKKEKPIYFWNSFKTHCLCLSKLNFSCECKRNIKTSIKINSLSLSFHQRFTVLRFPHAFSVFKKRPLLY